MKFSPVQILLIFVAPICSFEIERVAEGLDKIFLTGNVTAEETKSILTEARESYRMLTDYNSERNPDRKTELLTGVMVFASRVIRDLADVDMTLGKLFRNVNFYLKGAWNVSTEDVESLKTSMPIVIDLLNRKIGQQSTQRHRYDVKRILSGSGEDIFRESGGIDPTTLGYFFLESFATIFGLSWGIISMILSDFH